MTDQNKNKKEGQPFEEKVLLIRRVSKKITGGNYVTFSALVVVGDRQGQVGIGLGRGIEVPPAIQKAINYAKKHLVKVPLYKKTLPHEIRLNFKAAKILLKPAPEGTGLKVGSVARIILDLAGIENASGKIIRSKNQVVNSYAVMEALKKLQPKISRHHD
jgi:small subunit ribosomal protein S5